MLQIALHTNSAWFCGGSPFSHIVSMTDRLLYLPPPSLPPLFVHSNYPYRRLSPYLAAQEELLSIIEKYDGLVVRSGVTVDKDLIAAAKAMRIIGRAGTGGSEVSRTKILPYIREIFLKGDEGQEK